MMTNKKNTLETIADEALDDVAGGLLLPAVQAAREAARKSSPSTTTTVLGDGSVKPGDGSVKGVIPSGGGNDI